MPFRTLSSIAACFFALPSLASEAINHEAIVVEALRPASSWNFPVEDAAALSKKHVVYLAANLQNSGILSVAEGLKEAVSKLDWSLEIIDARGDQSKIEEALDRIARLAPDGLVLGGFNAIDHLGPLNVISREGTKIIGWHASAYPGQIHGTPVFNNITTNPLQVAQVATSYAIVATNRRAGAVIFTDSRFEIALEKSNEMARIIDLCATCQLLEVVDVRLDQTSEVMPDVVSRLQDTYGDLWNVSLGINDLYFDGAFLPLSLSEDRAIGDLVNVSAGDGSASAYQRIESDLFQSATVPEPLNFQGWQLAYELNRKMQGLKTQLFVAPTKLVTKVNSKEDGGVDWRFDPSNGYRALFSDSWVAK